MRKAVQIVLVLALVAPAAFAGMYYKAFSRSIGDGASSTADWEVEGWVEGDKTRVEFTASGSPLLPEGSYLLTQDGGRTVFLVNEAEGTYSRWDLEAMLGMLGNVLGSEGGLLSMEFDNLSVEKLGEEPAGSTLGLPSTRYRYRTSYDLTMKVLGMKRANSVVVEQDIVATDAIDHRAFGIWLRKEPPSLGNDSFDAYVRAEMEKIEGFPLKSVTTTVTAGGKKGKTTTQTVTVEVTELREESVAESRFVLDPDLVETPMPLAGVGEGSEEEERGGLRGLFKRRDGN